MLPATPMRSGIGVAPSPRVVDVRPAFRLCDPVTQETKRGLPGASYSDGSLHAWYDPSVRSDGANSARCINARAQRRSLRFAAISA